MSTSRDDPRVGALSEPATYAAGHPLKAYELVRSQCPVAWQSDAGGYWAVTGHREVQEISGDPQHYCSRLGFKLKDDSYSRLGEDIDVAMHSVLLATDPPIHSELRAAIARFFGPAAMREREPAVRARAIEVLEQFRPGQTIDVVRSLTAPFPIRVLCDLMEVPESDRERVYYWTNRLTGADDPEYNASPADVAAVFREVFEYGRELFQIRRARPGTDILSAFATLKVDGNLLEQRFIDSFFVLMVAAGNETTRNAITGTLYALAQNPEQRASLVADPSLIRNAVEEGLRVVSPVIHMRRTTTAAVNVAQVEIPSGQRVGLFYGAANYDPRTFTDPTRFDVSRSNARTHVAFGFGPHNCLGAPLARLEMRVFLEEFLARFPNYELAGDPAHLRSDFVAGIKKLQVTLD